MCRLSTISAGFLQSPGELGQKKIKNALVNQMISWPFPMQRARGLGQIGLKICGLSNISAGLPLVGNISSCANEYTGRRPNPIFLVSIRITVLEPDTKDLSIFLQEVETFFVVEKLNILS